MRISLRSYHLYLSVLLANALSGNCQEIRLTQLPILQDATWLVTGISQDPQGYMWFGTKRTGLYRYDGYNIISYKNQASNSNSLSYDAIETLYADSKGIVWIGTFGRGLDRFDPVTGNFTHFRFAANDPLSLSNDTVTAILEDKQKNLWIGTYGGIGRMDQKTGKFISYRYHETDPNSLSCNQVRTIYLDRQGTLWIGTGSAFHEKSTCNSGGLNRFDINSDKFTRYVHDAADTNSLIDNRVRAIFEDKYGTFYVGTAGDGLHTLDRNTGKFTRHLYDPKHPEKLSRPQVRTNLGYVDDHITFINEDATGAVWIGTFAGLNRYDPQTQKIKYYPSFGDSTNGAEDNIGWNAFTSRDGVLWFSTLGKGNIYHVDPFLKKIGHYDMGDQVNCIYQESPGKLWLGTQLTGLIRKDLANGTQKGFLFPGINSVQPNKQGKYWIGTIDGLFLFNPNTGTSVPYRRSGSTSKSDDFIISCLYVNKQENVWIGAAKGLDLLNTKTNSFTSYRHSPTDTNSLSDNSVTSILEDKEGRLWVGTHPDGGVNLLDQQTGKFKHYLQGRGITGTIYQDSKGIIWVGTHDGLYWYNPGNDNFVAMTDPDTGASLNFILNILADDQKNLWVVTGNELIKINEQRTGITRFGENEGVKPNTGYWGNFSGGDGHEIFFGDQSGYYIFNPGRITVNTRPPQILLTDFSINGKLVKASLYAALNQPDIKTQKIDLKYNENFLSFNLIAIHYGNPPDNRLLYMLENYDNNWRESGAGQKAYYFNVPPGHYTLKIKAANGNGIWAGKNIEINITPPWWQTWWAYALMALGISGCIWLFVLYRSRHLLKEKNLLEQQVNLRTREVVQQKEEISAQRDQLKQTLEELQKTQTKLMQQKEEISSQRDQLGQALEGLQNTQKQLVHREKMASLGELTAGIAHEIQNPLNFVKNFSEVNIELLSEIEEALAKGNIYDAKLISQDIKQNLEKITHHGKRADSIVKGMLHHSRNSTDKKELTDINDLADECLRLTYHGLRAKDKIFNANMRMDFDTSIENIYVIPQDIGRVFLNLFTNAFYSVTEKNKQQPETPVAAQATYEPTVLVTTKKLKDNSDGPRPESYRVEIRIRDNGLGIPQKVLDKIYQPFFTTKPTGQGTGLGLSLSYDVIKAHGGELKVETKEGEFAEFIITLPA
ncbi:MAG: two-component regulator propeller domain-containing protein [Ginsengibacter sp.]